MFSTNRASTLQVLGDRSIKVSRHPSLESDKMATSRRVQTIADDLRNVEFETSEEVDVTPTFDAMGLREDLLRGIYAYGNNLQTILRAQKQWQGAWVKIEEAWFLL